MRNPLLDKEFLYDLNQYRHKEIYAKIISLNFNEEPLEQIEGRVTSGSINIDGNSAVRRTCNLSLIAKDVNITDFYWGVSNKFTLEIGVKNVINSIYPDIIWFKQGIFVITSFNSSLTQNNYSISISGKDKMCLLNGDMGGNLPSSIDFGTIDTYVKSYDPVVIEDYTQYVANKYYVKDGDEYKLSKVAFDPNVQYYTQNTLLERESLHIKDIIREAVHTYGKEMYHNIVINDLDHYGLELMEYRGDTPLYMLFNEDASIYDNMVIDADFEIYPEVRKESYEYNQVEIDEWDFFENPALYYILNEDGITYTQYSKYDENAIYYTRSLIPAQASSTSKKISEIIRFNNAVDELNENYEIFYLSPDIIYENEKRITVRYSTTKLEAGHAAGYRTTELVYAGELISSIGESLTSMLDKIKSMLGAFEYFYDLDGRFIFQAKKIYSQNSWNTLIEADDNVFARDAVEESPYSYSFEDVNLISQFQNTPALNNLKNDYSIWGTRKSVTGAEIPIHARYAIHEKPVYYKNFEGEIFTTFDIEDIVPKPDKSRLPLCLQEGFEAEWWDIHDWAELYKTMTGEYPTGAMGLYGNRTCKMDLNEYFPPDPFTWNPDRPLFLFDVTPEGGLYSAVHNPPNDRYTPAQSCGHSYTWFIDRSLNENISSYIYDPTIPANVKILYSKVDWREIIYQMAKDYYKHNQEPNFYQTVANNNIKVNDVVSYYPTGETGYEMFYQDIQGFWRQLYDTNPIITYDSEGGYYTEEKYYRTVVNNKEEYDKNKEYYYIEVNGKYEKATTWSTALQYYTINVDLASEDTYKIQATWHDFSEDKNSFTCDYYLKGEVDDKNYSTTKYYWNKNVVDAPELLNYWLDFYDGDDPLHQYSISVIGDRPKVVNNSKVTSIYFRNVPQMIFTTSEEYDALDIRPGYVYIWLADGMEDLFSISTQGKSAEEEMNELFNQHSYCSEGISITAIPVYHLEPNTLIHVYNEENHINGKYQVNRLTIPLNYNGMMSISATKIIEQIY